MVPRRDVGGRCNIADIAKRTTPLHILFAQQPISARAGVPLSRLDFVPAHCFRLRRFAWGGMLWGSFACTAERTPVRVGDAFPRDVSRGSMLDVTRMLLRLDSTSRIELVPWSVKSKDFGVGEYAQARRFVDDRDMVAVVGHSGSHSTIMVEPLYREAGMPLLVPTATATELRTLGPEVFMLAPPNDMIGAFLVDEATTRLGRKRIAVLHVADPYGDGIRDGVVARLQSQGGAVVGSAALSGRECLYDAIGMDPIVRALLQRSRPDAVIVALPQQAARCASRALVRSDSSLVVLMTDSFVLPKELPFTEGERRNMHVLLFWEPGADSASQAFLQAARATLKRDPTPGFALEFDAYQLIVAAVRDGYTTRRGVMQWLRQLGTPGHPPFQGVTGPIEFTRPRTSVLRLKALRESVPPT